MQILWLDDLRAERERGFKYLAYYSAVPQELQRSGHTVVSLDPRDVQLDASLQAADAVVVGWGWFNTPAWHREPLHIPALERCRQPTLHTMQIGI